MAADTRERSREAELRMRLGLAAALGPTSVRLLLPEVMGETTSEEEPQSEDEAVDWEAIDPDEGLALLGQMSVSTDELFSDWQ